MLRCDRDNKELSEVMYVSIDSVRVTGGVEFEVYENNDMGVWINGNVRGLENDSRRGGVRRRDRSLRLLSEMRGVGRRDEKTCLRLRFNSIPC
ncbi:C-terminal binding protein AN-like [Pyrus ussuriensis x Pyrus communis]|uniref:C-terminal binding protein AN-like n=1 Tax=Pyrus ussuriensis x Pyrus communis TaxID=2448454 RepID=A0A5N5HC18_9ROSA|nr:C-terminal binding protein AN-like [Pyrus ussuriensis x Pyrus communis]